jgi:hypothetical protein
MPAASIDGIDETAPRPAPAREPSPVVGRSGGGQFVKVTYLRPEFAPDGADRDEDAVPLPAARPAPESKREADTGYQLVTMVREKAATTAGAGLGLLGLFALRSWRR